MKFEEILPALREGKKITSSIIKNSGYKYIYYKDGIVFNSEDDYWYITYKGVIESDDWEIVEEKKKVKVKLRDLTEKQFKKWALKNCGNYNDKCDGCPFQKVYCDRNPNIDDLWISSKDLWWIRNKDLYSDKYLDQEVEIYE